ncbi:MAG: methionyl-tRNA formyltransferase [Bacteroides sp.]|nr:methionyl-tRNA formyltransferase [Bacteroides sp.]
MTKQDLKIVFLGTPDFAVESLRRIVDGGYNVVGVVTMPDKPAGRGHKLYQSPVKEFAVEHGLHLMQPVKLKDPAFVDELRSLDADLFVVIAFRMLPEVVWTMPRLGTFNLHASLLPRYRGAAPINWAVINGDTETGVTTFFLKHEIDTGDIIAQEKVEILPTDNVGDVHDRLMELGAELTIKTIDDIIAGTLTTIPQEQLVGDTEPTPAPKIFKETCRIDWNLPAERIHNLVRGLSPYPAAWTTLMDGGTEVGAVKVFETRIVKSHVGNIPGEIIIEGDTLTVGCGNGEAIEILSLQAPGKRRMPTPDFLRGSRLVNPKFI